MASTLSLQKKELRKACFLRSPIQEALLDSESDESVINPLEYVRKIKHPLRALYEKLIGNGKIVELYKDVDPTTVRMLNIYILRLPITFKREYRKLTAKSSISVGYGQIKKIVSYGYRNPFALNPGSCKVEKSVISYKNCRRLKSKRKGSYYFTYVHEVKNFLMGG